jgi:hypothetical protein
LRTRISVTRHVCDTAELATFEPLEF